MIDDKQMLNSITETADMGRSSLNQILDQTKDNELRKVLRSQLTEYENHYHAADDMLRAFNQDDPKKANPIAKMSSYVTSNLRTLAADDPSSKIAEMVIEGSTMGMTTMERNLNNYSGCNQEVKELAKKHLRTEQSNIEELKKFL